MSKPLQQWLDDDVSKIKVGLKYYNEGFFRDPARPLHIDADHFFAPADGIILYQKVVHPTEPIVEIKGRNFTLKDLMQDDKFDQTCLVIGIFMSQYDVHINRVPYTGLLYYKKLPQIITTNRPMLNLEKHLVKALIDTDDMDYAFENERYLNSIFSPALNYKFYLIQIADKDVDVIAHYHPQGKYLFQNSRFSTVRYGSQTDLILPLSPKFELQTCIPDHYHVEAGLDILVKINFPFDNSKEKL